MKQQVQIPLKIPACKIILITLCLFIYGLTNLFAQQGTVAAGGIATGTGGSATYSTGLVSYITATGSGGNINQGLQQAATGIKFIPGKIEAENFDTKFGSQYTIPTTDAGGGLKVVGITNTSWMDYNVSVTQSGNYTVGFRVATTQLHAQFQIKLGNTVLSTVNIPGTGGWDNWQTITVTNVPLTAGNQTLRIQSTNNDNCDFNWMEYALAGNPPPTANAGANQTITLPTTQATLSGSGTSGIGGSVTYAWTQVGGTAATISSPSSASTTVTGLTTTGVRTFRLTVTQSDNQTATSDVTITVNPVVSNGKTIPGRIEAEAWDAKSGGFYAVPTTDVGGGSKVVNITNGNTMDYNVTVLYTGTYTVGFRVATTKAFAQFQIKLGATVLATVSIPNTFGWDNWQTITVTNVPLTAGNQTLRIQSTNNDNCDFNWMEYALAGNPPPTANAGANQTITLPTTQATLSGSGTSGIGGSVTYAWSQVGGTAATISSPSSATTTVTGLTTTGVRTFRLTVTQSDNQTATSDVTITVNPVVVSNGKTIPGRIEAEAFDAKSGGLYTIPTTDAGGGLKIVNITNGNTMDYNVTVLQSGIYTVGFRVATTKAFAQFQIKLGATVLATVSIPNTFGWDNWQTITVSNVQLTAGNQTIRIQSTNNDNCDFNWMEYSFVSTLTGNGTNLFAAAKSSSTTAIVAEKQKPVEGEIIQLSNATTLELFPNPVHDQFIVKVNNEYAGDMKVQIIDQSGKVMKETGATKNKGSNQMLLSAHGLPNGIYVIRIQTGDWSKSVKMIKL